MVNYHASGRAEIRWKIKRGSADGARLGRPALLSVYLENRRFPSLIRMDSRPLAQVGGPVRARNRRRASRNAPGVSTSQRISLLETGTRVRAPLFCCRTARAPRSP